MGRFCALGRERKHGKRGWWAQLCTQTVDSGMLADSGDQCDLAVANGQVILHGHDAGGPTMQVLGLPR